jgi:hypothetical protein
MGMAHPGSELVLSDLWMDVQTRSTTAFVLPVGHSGFMRNSSNPINFEGVDAAFRSTPNSIGSVLGVHFIDIFD